MPKGLNHIYAEAASDLTRRMSATQQSALRNIFMWIAFALRPLTLSEILYLVKISSGNIDLEEELQNPRLARFLRIADAEEAFIAPNDHISQLDMLLEYEDQPDVPFDGNYPIRFQERSMREFFGVLPWTKMAANYARLLLKRIE